MNIRQIKSRLRALWVTDHDVRRAFTDDFRPFKRLRERLIEHYRNGVNDSKEKFSLSKEECARVGKAFDTVAQYAGKMISPDRDQALAGLLSGKAKAVMQKRANDERRFLSDLKRFRKIVVVDGKRKKKETLYPGFQRLRTSVQLHFAILSAGPKDEITARILSAFYGCTITKKYVESRRRNAKDPFPENILKAIKHRNT